MFDLREARVNPCRNCGGRGGLIYDRHWGPFRVLCTYCNEEESGIGSTEQGAIDDWNNKNPMEEKQKEEK